MPLKVLVPDGFITIRHYAEKHMVPEPRVRTWVRMGLLPMTSIGSTDSRRWFVKDMVPPVKLVNREDPNCPAGHMPLNMWLLREKVTYYAAKKKIDSRELRVIEIVDLMGGVRKYISCVQRWTWGRPKKGPMQYLHRARPSQEVACTS